MTRMDVNRGAVRLIALGAIALHLSAAQGAEAQRPVLESEVATVEPLRPLKAHDLLVSHFDGGVRIIDGDTTKTVGQLYSSRYANFAVAPDQKSFYVAESYWAHGNRGTRADLLSVYGGDTLNLVAEISLPGRLISDPKTHNFHISSDGKYGFVYNFQPASSVVVVDLDAREVADSVEIPGCGQVLPWGSRSFAALCSDGSLATASADANGKYRVTRTPKFFDVDNDPIFDESVLDRQSGQAHFISYTGLVYPVQLGDVPQIGKAWSLQRAAGLSAATTTVGHVTWRPCGSVFSALHRASGRLFVLMHEGTHWDYGQQGSEVWVLDVRRQKLLTRLQLPQSASILAVTQDSMPLLFALSEDRLWVLDATSGEMLRTTGVINPSLVSVKDF